MRYWSKSERILGSNGNNDDRLFILFMCELKTSVTTPLLFNFKTLQNLPLDLSDIIPRVPDICLHIDTHDMALQIPAELRDLGLTPHQMQAGLAWAAAERAAARAAQTKAHQELLVQEERRTAAELRSNCVFRNRYKDLECNSITCSAPERILLAVRKVIERLHSRSMGEFLQA